MSSFNWLLRKDKIEQTAEALTTGWREGFFDGDLSSSHLTGQWKL